MAKKKRIKRKTTPNPVGRPSDYTLELGNKICYEIIQGKSLNAISKMKSMPNLVTIYRWLQSNEEFSKIYTEARAKQVDTLADQLVDIADSTEEGQVQRDRLRIDTRKWIAERMLPKKYGAVSRDNIDRDEQSARDILARMAVEGAKEFARVKAKWQAEQLANENEAIDITTISPDDEAS